MTEPSSPSPTQRLSVVIGATRPPGIGCATAVRFAAAGDRVVCVDQLAPDPTGPGASSAAPVDTSRVRPAEFERIVAGIADTAPDSVIGRGCTDSADWATIVTDVATEHRRLDVCCVLGGITGPDSGDGPLTTLEDAALVECLQINLIDSWRAARAAATAMIRFGAPGVIVALSSHAARATTPGAGALGAARLALEHLINTLAAEVAPHGIRCVTVSPLAVAPSPGFENPGLVALAARHEQSVDEWLAASVPLGRGQLADETAAVVEFLCSDRASFVSGITVPVHGAAG